MPNPTEVPFEVAYERRLVDAKQRLNRIGVDPTFVDLKGGGIAGKFTADQLEVIAAEMRSLSDWLIRNMGKDFV